ncbi:STAS domain-containing protein [Streptomyces sp. ADMS]|uniref:STAS domain-containing protein n=1 Tax=Streptomyces sp. ADMS TaxID=3071415 RepID=UPI00296FD8B4|nr:STAS domain-containing protein [Streptomyces sp. ADMS]MDW4910316.1 STAS domain-containing protein [Streptomyces sp. ADMS]
MPVPQLTVHRHDRSTHALITLTGEIDLLSAPLVQVSLEQCLRDGIHTIDVDLTPVTFCDCSGLNVFLHAAQQTIAAGGTLRLHNPPPTMSRILDLVGCGQLLLGPPVNHLPASPVNTPATPDPVPPHGSVQLVPVLSGDGR